MAVLSDLATWIPAGGLGATALGRKEGRATRPLGVDSKLPAVPASQPWELAATLPNPSGAGWEESGPQGR